MSRVPKYTKAVVRERATPQLTDLGRIEDAAFESKAISAGLDVATEVGTRIKLADDKSRATAAIAQAHKQDIEQEAEIKKQWQDNPEGYAKEREKFRKKRDTDIIKGLSKEAARMYQQNIDSYNMSQFKADTAWQNKTAISNTVHRADEVVDNLAIMGFEGVPLDQLAEHKSQLLDSLKDTLSAQELSKYEKNIDRRTFGGVVKGLINSDPYEARKVMESGVYNDSFKLSDIESLNNTIDVKIGRLEREALKQQNKMLKMRMEDTGQLAILKGAKTPDEMIAVQKNMGVSDGNISVLPKDVAKLEANRINGFSSSDEYIQYMASKSEEYQGENFNIFLRDLKKHGMSQDVSYLAMMDTAEDKPVMDAMFAMSTKDKDYKNIAKAQGIVINDIRADVESQIAETRDMFLAEGADITELNEKLTDVAVYFQTKGNSRKDAVKLATDWLNNKVQVAEYSSSELGFFDGRKVRVPVDYDAEIIGDSLTRAINGITKDDVNITGATGEFSLNELKRTASFVLGPDNNYYYLRDQFGSPILRKGTRDILKFPITELQEDNKDFIKKQQQKRFEEALKGFEEE